MVLFVLSYGGAGVRYWVLSFNFSCARFVFVARSRRFVGWGACFSNWWWDSPPNLRAAPTPTPLSLFWTPPTPLHPTPPDCRFIVHVFVVGLVYDGDVCVLGVR